jgi:two-component system alkaline phosphatase synthesis response regulator PhoP
MTTPPPGNARVLVIEDDPSIQLGLRMALGNEGYVVATAEDGTTGLELLRTDPWDLVILDVMLPKLNGYEVLRSLRAREIAVPVLMLSARSAEWDKVTGLDLGAEDYITKPFSIPELLARVRAALRRQRSAPQLVFGDIVVDPQRREVLRGGRPVELTVTEYNVLWALVRARGSALTRQQIFEAVWGVGHHGTHRTIDNFIGQLRAKLEADPSAPSHLVTVRGVGYRLE